RSAIVMKKLYKVLTTILHDSIYQYKRTGSAQPLQLLNKESMRTSNNKKGAIALVRSKEDLSTPEGVKGYVVTSLETLLEDFSSVSHWNPNVSNYLRYTDKTRTRIQGHGEENLQQINTFVVDIDTKKQPYTEI